MGFLEGLYIVVGTLLVLLILLDVFLVVLHTDFDSLLGSKIQKFVWWLSMKSVILMPSRRRWIYSFSGPLMLASTFLFWFGIFIFGFALIYYPFLNTHFYTSQQPLPLSFADALYYSGNAGTVLGFGEIYPLTPGLKIVTFFEAAIGFILITGIVTYVLNVVSGMTERNKVAGFIHGETGNTGHGISFVVHILQSENMNDLMGRLENMKLQLQELQEKIRQFPLLEVHYRSVDPVLDPEYMLKTAARITLVVNILSHWEKGKRLTPTAINLRQIFDRIMKLIIDQHFSKDSAMEWESAEITKDEFKLMRRIVNYLEDNFNDELLKKEMTDEKILEFACRCRIFFGELNQITKWQLDHTGWLEDDREYF